MNECPHGIPLVFVKNYGCDECLNEAYDEEGEVTYRPWGQGNQIGQCYRITEPDLSRVGHSWMEGRLRAGDLVLCCEHSGDYFYDYILVYEYDNALKGLPQSKFGSYTLSTPVVWELLAREFHLLMAGESIPYTKR